MNKVSANAIAIGIFDFLSANHKEKSNIIAIRCYSTGVNTGAKGGAIRMIELKLNKPVHWFICQLQANELPLRHLFQTLDEKTTDPKGYSGNIGKVFDGCEKLDVVNFEPALLDLLDMNQTDLSTDQQYLYNIHKSVPAGKLSEGQANKNPEKNVHFRWLTTANRILRLCVSTDEPSQTLKIIVKYIMKLYAPLWFAIKNTSSSQNGVLHLLIIDNASDFVWES